MDCLSCEGVGTITIACEPCAGAGVIEESFSVPVLIDQYLAALTANEAKRGNGAAKPYATFSTNPGRRYTKIVMTAGGQQSVHAFVENATGLVFKAAGWAAPAKGARYDLTDPVSKARMFEVCQFAGGYLYR